MALTAVQHALVLREVTRFSAVTKAQLALLPDQRIRLTVGSTPRNLLSSKEYFGQQDLSYDCELNEQWRSPLNPSLMHVGISIPDTLKKHGAIGLLFSSRFSSRIRVGRWEDYYRAHVSLWLGLLQLRIAHELWLSSHSLDLLLVEEPGSSLGFLPRVRDAKRSIEQFLRVNASLDAEVSFSTPPDLFRKERKSVDGASSWWRTELTGNQGGYTGGEYELEVKVNSELPLRRPSQWSFRGDHSDDD